MIFYGILLLAFAVGSWILPKYGTQFFIMSWVDNWGLAVGIAIRCSLALIGASLLIKGLIDRRKRP